MVGLMGQDRDRVDRFLPLKPFVLDVLLELAEERRHGWSLIRSIQQRDGGERILPANFYRTLRALRDDGLIQDVKSGSTGEGGERRQYFELTSLGAHVARAEVKRLEALVVDPRARKLLNGRLRAHAG
jgi:DNA-binding PadR family transcriptional regulator